MALTLLSANNASTVLSTGISSTATTLTVNTGTGGLFPSPVSGTSFFKLTLIDAATGTLTEIVHVTARTGDTMTIVRGQEGTANRPWSANDIAANMMTAGTLDLFAQSGTLGGAASLNVGTTAGTVAAGDDSRIVNAISIKDTNIKLSGNLRAQGNLTAQGSLIAKTNIAADGRCDIVGDVRGGRIISKSDVIAGEGRAEGHATLTVDGNIYGTLWGTDLYTYLTEPLIGVPMPYPLSSVPDRYFKCNGAAFDTSAYPRLALKYPSGVLPDMRGNVIRGWDDGRRIDEGRVLLSFQDDAIRNITGVYAPAGGKAAEASYFSGAFTRLDVPAPQGGQVVGGNTVQGAKFDASRVVPTASENRMKNIAFNYIVRAL